MRRVHTWGWGRTRRYDEPSNDLGPLSPRQSCPACIIDTRGYDSREGQDLRKIASYFAAKSWPTQNAAPTSVPPPKGIAQCQPCHQPNFQGGPPAPRLAGLSYEYLLASMHSFAADQRTNNGDMPKFMQMLTESERDTIARYLSAL
jgi:mono/diheme cytochrome c family protein